MHITSDLIQFLARIPRQQFSIFQRPGRRTGILCLKFIEPADAGTIDSNPAVREFDNFQAFYLRSLSVFFAYAFVFDNKVVETQGEYATIQRPLSLSVQHHTGVVLKHHDPHVNIYESQDGASLLAVHGLSTVISQEMVRRKKVSKDTD